MSGLLDKSIVVGTELSIFQHLVIVLMCLSSMPQLVKLSLSSEPWKADDIEVRDLMLITVPSMMIVLISERSMHLPSRCQHSRSREQSYICKSRRHRLFRKNEIIDMKKVLSLYSLKSTSWNEIHLMFLFFFSPYARLISELNCVRRGIILFQGNVIVSFVTLLLLPNRVPSLFQPASDWGE